MDTIGASKFCNGLHDLTTPLSGTVCCYWIIDRQVSSSYTASIAETEL